MSATASLIPSTQNAILELLAASALGAARSCSGADPNIIGGTTNSTCGTQWFANGWDGTSGLGQQLSALEIIQGLLLDSSVPPAVNNSAVKIQEAAPTNTIILPTATPRPTGVSPIDVGGVGNSPGVSSPATTFNGWFLAYATLVSLLITGVRILL